MPFYTDPVTKMEHKFACNHCIRGHRSTNCSHNDRPLFYIRKKGRPVSQCTQCRALRKNRSLHTRCECPSRVQNRGQGGSTSESADLPNGMSLEAAKEYVERLSMDQGGCRNCNSNRCQCDGRPTQSIAPASPAPVHTIPTGTPSPYTLAFPPNFTSVTPNQIRNHIYPTTTPQYATMPQFTGMPSFGNGLYQPSQGSVSSTSNPNLAVHVQHFQRRQEHLVAATQRRLQQEAEESRRQSRDSDNPLVPLSSASQSQLPEPYHHHRASLPISYGSSLHVNANLNPSDHRLSVPQSSYPETRPPDTERSGPYRYVHDTSQSLSHVPYATTLSNTLFRFPPSMETQPLKHPMSSFQSESTLPAGHTEKTRSYHTETHTSSTISIASTNTALPLEEEKSNTSSDNFRKDAIAQVDGQSDSNLIAKGILPEIDEDAASDVFPGLDKVFDNWDAADNEWLYSLQTECAKPGAVCECGDSCCCPGCFTHTNNPGDRGVYNTILNKLGSILETEKEEPEGLQSKPCVPALRSSTSGADAKL